MKPLLFTALVLSLLIGFTGEVSAQTTPLISCGFQDALPVTCQYSLGAASGSVDMGERLGLTAPGPCGTGFGWNRERVAPGAGNGGWSDRGFIRYTLCDHDLLTSLTDAWQAGFGFDPPGTSTVWPTVFFVRFRLFVENPIVTSSIGDSQLKWFIWHGGVFGGDQRVMMHFYRGDHCGTSTTTTVCLSLLRNIFVGTDEAQVSIPVGQWVHIQGSWRHGPVGTSFVKLWRNNNSLSSPTSQQLNMDVCQRECPGNPGGTSEWVRSETGYHAPFDWGNRGNTSTFYREDWRLRFMDLQIDDAFDAAWAPVGTPTAPTNLRVIIPPSAASLLPIGPVPSTLAPIGVLALAMLRRKRGPPAAAIN